MQTSQTGPAQTVGLEHRFRHRPGRPANRSSTAQRPHWTDLTLTTGVLLGELFPYAPECYTDEPEFLPLLYACFKNPVGLDKLSFKRTNLYRAERDIYAAINKHFHKAYNIYVLPTDYGADEGFHVMWEIEQPEGGFHALYIEDIYKCQDNLVAEVLFYGLHSLCWDICYGSWHGPYQEMVEAVFCDAEDNRSELNRLKEIERPDDKDKAEIKRLSREIRALDDELAAYNKLAFDRHDGIKPEAFKRLIARLDIKRYPNLVHWANTIHRLYKDDINIERYVPPDPEQVVISPKDYNYIVLRPGFVSDRYESDIHMYAQDANSELYRLDYYGPHKICKARNINWRYVTKVLFGMNIKRLAYRKKALPLLKILV
jgi:hypothetical protein